ncbi:uncharacterized protein LOC128957847 [Oppia nitens]|uniref:uncharacterized protein LOC128957847 n=1 Tax=Oppia nitens TaxID=1686743 RepID=UPI0023DA3162|nr:uncharacterized protein LOC128957847 [Oppia nitens]
MDELSDIFQSVSANKPSAQRGRPSKRKSCPPPVLAFASKASRQSISSVTSDEGVGLSMDDSIAHSVKRRQRNVKKNFDFDYFFDSTVKQIESKYKNKVKDDAIIDLNAMEIVSDKKGVINGSDRREIGFFADNTLEKLRQKSFRKENNIPDDSSVNSTPIRKSVRMTKNSMTNQTIRQNSKSIVAKSMTQLDKQLNKQLTTNIAIASDDESDISDGRRSAVSEEMDDNHPLMVYENRMFCIDKDIQIDCLKKTIEMLKNDSNGHFKTALKLQVMNTLNLTALPSGPHVIPIVKYNIKGEPNFEFFFGSANLPTNPMDSLHVDREIIDLSKVIYDCIQLPYKPFSYKSSAKQQLFYGNKKQLEFRH